MSRGEESLPADHGADRQACSCHGGWERHRSRSLPGWSDCLTIAMDCDATGFGKRECKGGGD